MCGIIGISAKADVSNDILNCLKSLSYRGYDSAGMAMVGDGQISERKIKGKVSNLEDYIKNNPISGNCGIGHTRWATHGEPNTINAHPHTISKISIVHNGIIENYHELKTTLKDNGVNFISDTDTEIISHLINIELMNNKQPLDAFVHAISKLEGAYAIAAIFSDYNNLMIASKVGSPLVFMKSKNKTIISSDAYSIAEFGNNVTYLEDGDILTSQNNKIHIFDRALNKIKRPSKRISKRTKDGLNGHEHFMMKEIKEQPDVLSYALSNYLDFTEFEIKESKFDFDFSNVERIIISACGTAYFAGMVAKYWLENIANIKVDLEIASEFRYKKMFFDEKSISLFISQSGETADTLAALKYAKQNKQRVVSIVNTEESSISNESDLVLPIFAGQEIGVASTKAFTCQLATIASLVLYLAGLKGAITKEQIETYIQELMHIPSQILQSLEFEPTIKKISKDIYKSSSALFIGRGSTLPLAFEGALKLKEISYIHAEGIASGELKHGAIALVDKNLPVIVLAPDDLFYVKNLSNMNEVYARSGKITMIGKVDNEHLKGLAINGIDIDITGKFNIPIIMAVPLQLLAYHVAKLRNKDIDQPRNLAKSVTVE
ncbi:MAG: glutamine--fructose-6-phosphate transaminase (isomerizing) [Alphaproteobacteria bacterium]|uniref:Glutamine--fructose-6-phosphate aminotransferase [isomerizing] n=1 Tax=PS1 clade bacterium TaxID=2175152 RepID=A0A368DJ09_9PROT|nr:MAG: glutamine--fructose-6-phosphate transaminase (isomerizing) [PS1 clade bacterium]